MAGALHTVLKFLYVEVGSKMGDHLQLYNLEPFLLFNQAPWPTQPGHPSVGRHNEYWPWSPPLIGKKGRVLHNSRSYNQDC